MNIQNAIKKLIKEKLSKALTETGKSSREIGKLTGINHFSVYCYMKGTYFPTMKHFDMLIETLCLDEREIMRYDLANEIIDKQINKK